MSDCGQRGSLVFLLAALLCVSAELSAGGHSQKPNIVILLADDLDWHDVGYHGGPLKTPHIDQLAQEGLELNRFYVAPLCSPSRAGLMTGVYPHRLGFGYRARPMPANELPANAMTLATMLAEAGYQRRAYVGKWHLQKKSGDNGHPLDQGFTEFYGLLGGAVDYFSHQTISLSKDATPTLDWYRDRKLNDDRGYSTDLLADEAVRIIKQSTAQAPFFVYVAFNAPHVPLQAKGHRSEIDWAQVKDRQSPAFSQLFDTYSAMVSAMDEGIGRILTAIDDEGLRDNTLVLFLSDNGGMFNLEPIYQSLRGHKGTAWERGIRVPALLRWPAVLPVGVRIDQPISYLDVMPTLADLVGSARRVEDDLDGVSMAGVLVGGQAPIERNLYLGQDALVNKQWKLIDDQLYRIEDDPGETTDLAPQHPQLVKQLQQQLEQIKAMDAWGTGG